MKILKDNYGKLVVGLILIAVSTVSLMAQRASDSTEARIKQCEVRDEKQDQCIKGIEVKLGVIEIQQKQAERSDFILHEKMNELLLSAGMSKAAIIEIEMRNDTSQTNASNDSTGSPQ